MIELLSIPAVRRTVEALLLLAAIAAVLYSIYRAGEQTGQRAAASAQVEASHAQFTSVEDGFKQQLAAATAAADQYRALAATLMQSSQKFADNAQHAADEASAAKEKLATVSDSQLQQDLEAKLGGPLLRPDILRADDAMVTNYPLEVQQVQDLSSQIGALDQASAAKDKQIDAISQERDAAITAHNALLPLYAQAYNAAIVGHRKWYCAWICKPKKTIPLPDPVTLTTKVQAPPPPKT